MSGFSPIITTASKRHEEYLKSLGATHVVDRVAPLSSFASEVKNIVEKPVLVAYDAISDVNTQNAAHDALSPGGKVILGLPPQIDASKLTDDKEIVEVFGNVHVPEQTPVGLSLYRHVTALLEAGDIKARIQCYRSQYAHTNVAFS